MRRAIVTFVDDNPHLLMQFKALYQSFKYVASPNTDLVAFAPQKVLPILPNDCIKVGFESISHDGLWKDYHFINSIACLAAPNANFLYTYDLILRSDVDTFLTPSWNDYYPSLYTAGRGCYVNDAYTQQQISGIAQHLGLNHKGIFNIGSTHYGEASLVIQVCKLTMEVGAYIYSILFKDSPGAWPSWYKGVTSMYAGEIAVNHLVAEFIIDPLKLDYESTHTTTIDGHPHIHCWHTDNLFSKFMFVNHHYDSIPVSSLNKMQVNEYCLYMALTSLQNT